MNIIADAQAGDQNFFVYINVSLRTRIPVLVRLLHRDRHHRHFRPPSTRFRTPIRRRFEVVRLILAFPGATDAGLLSYL